MTDPIPTALAMDQPPSAKLIYLSLRHDGPQTQTELVESTGLSRSAISNMAGRLVDAGWIVESRVLPDGTGGNPPKQYHPQYPCPSCGERFETEETLTTHTHD